MSKPACSRLLLALAALGLVMAGGLFEAARAQGQCPCDSMSGAGKASITTSGGKASFGFTGGVKQGSFWGDLTYKDYDLGLTVEGTAVTGYAATSPNTRIISGSARTNLYGDRTYRITATDGRTTFQIDLDNGYSRQGPLLSGKITLHDGNRKSTPPPGYTCGIPPDATPPTATIVSPGPGSTVSGSTMVSANASDDVGLAGVQFELDGAPLGAEDTAAPYSVPWNTATAANGSHTLTAVARDTSNNTGASSPVAVTVSNAPPDTTPPTVTITSPSSGSVVSSVITVAASASDNVGVTGVQFKLDGAPLGGEDTAAPYSASWDTRTASNGSHTLTAVARDAAGNTGASSPVAVTVLNVLTGPDVFVALTNGQVQWRNSDGLLLRVLVGTSAGQASSLNFDSARNLYVPHWYNTVGGLPGNTIERFDANGNLILGTFGSGYNCDPSSVTFDPAGNAYVGQADCTGDILKFGPGGDPSASFDVPVTQRGTDHIDLAADGCTMFYASRDKNIYRYNVCTHTVLPNFNLQPLPGTSAFHVRILPDRGVLVADYEVITRLDAAGNVVQTYDVPSEAGHFWGGVDFVGDGTFWASNGYTSHVFRFNIVTGAVVSSFIASTDLTAAGVAVRR